MKCLVTGGTRGIGYHTALGLLRRGAEVTIVGPDAGEGEAARAALAEHGEVRFERADLSELSEVRQLATAMPEVDILINNAGIYATARRLTPDGYESTLAVNFLAPFLLTSLLLPALERSPLGGRVVNVASVAHWAGRIDWDDLHRARRYHGFFAYAQSKLAVVLFTRAFARRYPAARISCNAAHPGIVGTRIVSDGPIGTLLSWSRPLMRTPEIGARTSLHLATSRELAGISGGYFANCKPARLSPAARNDALADRLWQTAEQLTGAHWPTHGRDSPPPAPPLA